MKNNLFISVVIPAFNEKGNVIPLANRFYNVFKKLNIKYELIYVLAGTKEESGYNELIKAKIQNTIPLYRDNIKGYGPSLYEGFDSISNNSTHVLTMDADNHKPEEIPLFLKRNEDIIIGSRYIKGGHPKGPKWKLFLSKLMNKVLIFITGINVNDNTSGYRLYKRNTLINIYKDTKQKGFEVLPEILMVAQNKGYTISEVPIDFQERKNGKSKMKIFKSIKGYLKLLWWRVCYRKNI